MNELKRRAWGDVVLWVTLIYSTLYIVRPACEYLKKITPFALLTNIFMWVALAATAAILIFKTGIKKPSTFIFLALAVIIYGISFLKVQYPEEKIHFLEYGILSFLIFRACRFSMGVYAAYGCAFLLTSILGWGDEGIQGLLPNRYYQTSDVLLNGFSGALGLLLTFIFEREHRGS